MTSTTTTTSTTTSASSALEIKPHTSPISTLNSDLARWYSHLHHPLLLSLFYLSFEELVKDPTTALLSGLVPLGVLQVGYVVLCLPPVMGEGGDGKGEGRKSRGGGKGNGGRSGEAESMGGRIIAPFILLLPSPNAIIPKTPPQTTPSHHLPNLKLTPLPSQPALLSLTLTSILATPVLLCLLILTGAPLTTHIPHTTLLAAHMAHLLALPLFYCHGVDARRWRDVASLYCPFDDVWGAAVGGLLGAWGGAVPLPLDWDREWQRWPVTVVTGAYIGVAVGKFVGGMLLKGKRIEFD
ncbi:PIG-F-domain-containing protein [Aulographum hederae CBS 113979]|uniref:PIG-F-domain-containing protein n=1 Tax=Aulographum hederae CBS 113979 TaxID=1176131 RepID=A0A6G1HDR7_9PEZI|nr:PIG-F-domain-containing protein [Aulographum hederae CBS 113979]